MEAKAKLRGFHKLDSKAKHPRSQDASVAMASTDTDGLMEAEANSTPGHWPRALGGRGCLRYVTFGVGGEGKLVVGDGDFF